MFKARIDHLRRSAWAVCLLLAGAPTAVPPAAAAAAELSALERRWLLAALPVLQFAREQRLPLDIVVQPQAAPGETPLGMAYVDGRCKLVLSMRGNPEAQALLERIPPELLQPVVEAIAAHELGHCWRHVQQHWGTLPATVRDATADTPVAAEHAELLHDMWRTRREEGFADLVGLAWTLRHHHHRYEQVHDWHVRLRARPHVPSGPHDTRVWVRLAADKGRFKATDSLFEQVQELWQSGLRVHGLQD
jgi:hypothetical protein